MSARSVNRARRMAQAGLLVCLGFCVVGCTRLREIGRSYIPVKHYTSPELEAAELQRVLLLPFTRERGDDEMANCVEEAFELELRRVADFEVIRTTGLYEHAANSLRLVDGDTLNVEAMIAMEKMFRVDAFLMGSITHYRTYAPPLLGMEVRIVSSRTGAILWACKAVCDAGEAQVAQAARYYCKNILARKQTGVSWDLLQLSMKHFARFVSYQMLHEGNIARN